MKFLINKVNVNNKLTWMIHLFTIFLGILSITTLLNFLKFIDDVSNFSIRFLYDFISTSFYLIFFMFLDWYLKALNNSEITAKKIRWLKVIQWISFVVSITLIYLTIGLNQFHWPDKFEEQGLYLFNVIWPGIFMPNLGFIIITILIFYNITTLKDNSQLKEENNFTI